jgi:hypothetical protein
MLVAKRGPILGPTIVLTGSALLEMQSSDTLLGWNESR